MSVLVRHGNSPSPRRQGGIALITAIFVVTLATIAASAMIGAAAIAAHRTANITQAEAADWYAEGVESWIKEILVLDAKTNKTDSFADAWATPVPYLPLDGGAARGAIEDLQGRFNLNNLATGNVQIAAIYQAQFERLLDNLPNFDASGAHGIGAAVRDWVDADSDRSAGDGAEDEDYLALDTPYRAANQPMRSISELLLVKGMTPELYAALAPYVAALPAVPTAINVNTASEPVLLALAPDIDKSKLERFIAVRKSQPANTVSALYGAGEFAFMPATVPQQMLSVTTHWFELHAEIVVGSGRVSLYSVINRPDSGTPVVVAHSTDTE